LLAVWRWLSKEHPAQTDAIPAVTVGEKAEVTHAVEAGGKQVQEKSPDELVRMKAHDLLAITSIVPIILPSEGNMVVIKFDDAAVGDSDAVGVWLRAPRDTSRPIPYTMSSRHVRYVVVRRRHRR
jgi:hypothetical protein